VSAIAHRAAVAFNSAEGWMRDISTGDELGASAAPFAGVAVSEGGHDGGQPASTSLMGRATGHPAVGALTRSPGAMESRSP
jgi:hypothetical protein